MLQEGRGAAFRDPRFAVHDEILSEAQRVLAATEAREHDARVSPNVLHLLMKMQVTGNELVLLDAHPDDRDLRAAVAVEGRQVNQRRSGDELPDVLGDIHIG